jgi:hypothetical protein
MVSGQKNQTKTHKLLTELEAKSEEDEIYPLPIEMAMDQTRKMKNASTKKDFTAKSGKNGKGFEKRRSDGSSESYRIPNEQRTDKFVCNRCKDNGGAHTTHNTSDCNRYKADGTPNKEYGTKSGFSKKGKDGKDKSYKGGRDKQQISHLTSALDDVKKELKKLKRSQGKKRKRHSRHPSPQ